jgi:hypothetical protein
LQRSEQKGRLSPVEGLPQIGHGFAAAARGDALPDDLAGIQPAEADRKALAAQERDRLIERQADDVGIGADHLDHE